MRCELREAISKANVSQQLETVHIKLRSEISKVNDTYAQVSKQLRDFKTEQPKVQDMLRDAHASFEKQRALQDAAVQNLGKLEQSVASGRAHRDQLDEARKKIQELQARLTTEAKAPVQSSSLAKEVDQLRKAVAEAVEACKGVAAMPSTAIAQAGQGLTEALQAVVRAKGKVDSGSGTPKWSLDLGSDEERELKRLRVDNSLYRKFCDITDSLQTLKPQPATLQ
jgi:chromosome segregation ATPase